MAPTTVADLVELIAAVYLGGLRAALAILLIAATAVVLADRATQEHAMATTAAPRRRGAHSVHCWERHPECALRAAAALTAARRDHYTAQVRAGLMPPAAGLLAQLRERAARLADAATLLARDGPAPHTAAITEARQLLTDEHTRGRSR